MITFIKGDIFSSKVQTIVNTVNCVGVMGAGIALEYKKRYPRMFSVYKQICDNKLLDVGKLFLYKSELKDPNFGENEKWILNFPTKKDWRNPSELKYIEEGLRKFVDTYKEKGITSIAFPHLGCQNGGLDFESQVKPLMIKYLENLDLEIEIYEYI